MSYEKEINILPLVRQASMVYNVPEALILAHMKQESNFDPDAVRDEPAINDASIGLMQVLLNTAKSIDSTATYAKLFEPQYNISIGTRYIKYQLERYDNIKDSIAAYNAGTAYTTDDGTYVSKSGNDVQYYVDKVYANYQNYINWLNGYGENSILKVSIIPLVILIGIGIWLYKRKK